MIYNRARLYKKYADGKTQSNKMTLFASLLLSLTICGSIGIKLIGHRYEDVYIVIQNTVAEDPKIIDNIKVRFNIN